jgi:hypothetical protein
VDTAAAPQAFDVVVDKRELDASGQEEHREGVARVSVRPPSNGVHWPAAIV